MFLGELHDVTPAALTLVHRVLVEHPCLGCILFVLFPLLLQLLSLFFLCSQFTLASISRLLQPVGDGLHTGELLLLTLAGVAIVCHAGVEGDFGVVLLEPLTCCCWTTGTFSHLSLYPIKLMDKGAACLLVVILLSLFRWCYPGEFRVEKTGRCSFLTDDRSVESWRQQSPESQP